MAPLTHERMKPVVLHISNENFLIFLYYFLCFIVVGLILKSSMFKKNTSPNKYELFSYMNINESRCLNEVILLFINISFLSKISREENFGRGDDIKNGHREAVKEIVD